MIDKRKCVAIIPARGGSKGIPKKNLKKINGIPLVLYSVSHAKLSKYIDEVIVSTDSKEIQEVCRLKGARVIRRPEEISGDKSSTEEAMLHVLEKTEYKKSDLVVLLQPTSPLRKPGDVDFAIEKLHSTKSDSLFSSTSGHHFIWYSKNDNLDSITYDYQSRQMRQDITGHYLENGSIYISTVENLVENNNRLGGKISTFGMDFVQSLQIDNSSELELVRDLISKNHEYQLKPSMDDLANVKLVILDFDGVLTDNSVSVYRNGIEKVFCSRSDGIGISRLKKSGREVLVLSSEKNEIVKERCKKLNVSCIHGVENKLTEVKEILRNKNLSVSEVLFVGNDLNDLELVNYIPLSFCPLDSHIEIIKSSSYVLNRRGGHGVVSELWTLIEAAKYE